MSYFLLTLVVFSPTVRLRLSFRHQTSTPLTSAASTPHSNVTLSPNKTYTQNKLKSSKIATANPDTSWIYRTGFILIISPIKALKRRRKDPYQQCCGTPTGNIGTVTFCLSGTWTVIKWIKKRWHDRFLDNNAASINIKKARFFTQFLLRTGFRCLDTEPEPEK